MLVLALILILETVGNAHGGLGKLLRVQRQHLVRCRVKISVGDTLEQVLALLLGLLQPVILEHLGLALLANRASSILLDSFGSLSRNLFVIARVSFRPKLHNLVRDDRQIDLLVFWLLAAVQDALEDLVLLDGRVPLVLAQGLRKAVLALRERRLLPLLLSELLSLLLALVFIDVGVRGSQHFIDLFVRRLAHYRAEPLTLHELIARLDGLFGGRPRMTHVELVVEGDRVEVGSVVYHQAVILLAVFLEERVHTRVVDREARLYRVCNISSSIVPCQ